MTEPEELWQQIQKLRSRVADSERRVVEFSRSLVPTLRDAGREHAARELERLLFELDAVMGEMVELVSKDPENFFRMVLKGRSS